MPGCWISTSYQGGGGGGGGYSHVKVTGALVGFFEGGPERVPRSCFVGVASS